MNKDNFSKSKKEVSLDTKLFTFSTITRLIGVIISTYLICTGKTFQENDLVCSCSYVFFFMCFIYVVAALLEFKISEIPFWVSLLNLTVCLLPCIFLFIKGHPIGGICYIAITLISILTCTFKDQIDDYLF